MKAILSTIILSLLCLWIHAQQSDYTYIFQITADEAEKLYQQEKAELYSEPYLYQLVDSFKNNLPLLNTGHYLLVHAEKESLNIRQHSVHHYGVQQIEGNNRLMVSVLDVNGQPDGTGQLYFEGKPMEWQKTLGYYRTKRPRKDGWLRIEMPGDTLFYSVEYEKIKPHRQRFFRTPVGYIISSPYRWAKNTYHFFKRGVGRGDWYLNWRRIWPFPKKNRNLRGYSALNQPTYRPGDTLRVKAYLTKRSGRPWNHSLQLKMYGYRGQQFLQRELVPDRPGAFTHEIILADSLQLDQQYYLQFSVPLKSKYGTKQQQFKLEDYQLDAATFKLSLSESKYRAGEPVIATVSGKDQNDNPLNGASVELIVLRQSVSAIGVDSLLIPDTLWTHQQDLSLREDSAIRLPDSIFPPASMNVKVQAFFSTVGGESAQESVGFQYHYQAGRLDYTLEKGQWKLRYLYRDSSIAKSLKLISYRAVPPFLDTMMVSLPGQISFDPFANSLLFYEEGKVMQRITVAEEERGLQAYGQHQRDSLIVGVFNPHQLRISYQLYEGKRQLAEGELEEDFSLHIPAKADKQYQLSYQYTWAGSIEKKQSTYQSYERQLRVQTELPDQVFPGQTVQVKIKATDSKKRPAQGVEMVAGAVNGQFNSMAHLSPPQLTYKKRKGFQERHRFSLQAANQSHNSRINAYWYRQMGLDTMLYYKIRYPEEGVFTQSDTILKDSFYLKYPQISPYVVENHQLQPVYLIYLNRELVYSHYSEDDQPYAFSGLPGYNQLRLRTREAEYRIDSIYLRPGQKISFAIDASAYGTHPVYGQRIKWTSAKKELSSSEKKMLNQKLIRIRKEEKKTVSYLCFDSTRIFRWNNHYQNSTPKVVGPVAANRQLTYLQRDGLRNTFLYEPGYIYEIREGRERLYAADFLGDKTTYVLPEYLPHPKVDQLALIPEDIIATSPLQKKINFRNGWMQVSEGGDLQLIYNLETDSTLAAISLQNASGAYSISPGNQRYFTDLPVGYYELNLITKAGFTSSKKCWVYPHQLQVLDLRSATFVQDTSLNIFDDLYTMERIKPSFINDQNIPKNNNPDNPYRDVGYLASGTAIDKETGDPLLFATILLKGTSFGTVTDFDGNWSLWVPDSDATIVISYLGYTTQEIKAGHADENIGLTATYALDEVLVVSYRVPLVEQDNTTQGATLTADQISRLPTRNIKALAATTAGLMGTEGDALNTRGSRLASTYYYLDGQRIGGALPGNTQLFGGSSLRSNFRDHAFWTTDLITDQEGEAYFTVTFPDDITQWEAFVLGMDDRKRAGAWYGQTAAFKPVLAQLYLPPFLLPGDQVDLVGSSVNYTNDTFQVNTQFEVAGEVLLKKEHQLTDGITDKINYIVSERRDSLTAKYTLQTSNYEDGEERSIPIFRVGTEETIGRFYRLQGDTTIELSFQPEDGPLTIYAEPDMLRLMLKEIDELIDYPYGCNEQSASRLLALLMHKKIQQMLDQPFTQEKDIQKMLALLRQRQLPDGSWGWWGGSASNQWMTIYVLRALHEAQEAGYATEAYEKGLLFLTNQLSQLEGKKRLEALALFSEVGQNMDYESLLMPYDTLPGLNWTTLTTTLIRAQQRLPVQLDTLSKYRKTTLFDGHYWGKDAYGFYNNSIQYTLLAYRIYQAFGETSALEPIRQFFLENRHRGPGYSRYAAYRNTFEAAMILKTILPDLLKDYEDQVELDFKQELQIFAGETIRWDTLPQQITIAATAPVSIRKTGVGKTYLTAYQQRWNPQPERVEGPFVVTTSLWQGKRQTSQLEQSRPGQIKVELTVEKAASYVLLEVPIPAGCSYGSKPQSRWSDHETYREYAREKVAIFCEQLEPGHYTYYVELEPRFTGQFQLNPAKAEQMYFPIFFGREGMKKVEVKAK